MADDGAADRHEHQTYNPRQRDNGHVGHLSCAQILLIPEPGGRYFDRYGTSRRGRCGGGRRPTHLGRSAGSDRVGHMYLAAETSPAGGGTTATGGMTGGAPGGTTGRGDATGGGAITTGALTGCKSPLR
jgi:hypothetical protein